MENLASNMGSERGVVGNPPLLAVRGLWKAFSAGGWLRARSVVAVRDVSFDVAAGRMLAVVGESGSGKSTIARLIARLSEPTAGEIRLDGVDVLRAEPRRASRAYRRRVQMVFQDPFGSLNPAHTVGYHLVRPLLTFGIASSTEEAEGLAKELLATVGLDATAGVLAKFPHELSGGQRQRVAIARALSPEPSVLLADEPTSMLDVSLRVGVLNLLDRLKRTRSLACVYITHDVASARYVADDMLVMYSGVAVEAGPAEEVTQRPRHPYTRLLLSAVPDVSRRGLPQAVPPPAPAPRAADAGAGCPFVARCPHAVAACGERMPPPVPVGPEHWARCHRLPELADATPPRMDLPRPSRPLLFEEMP